MARYFWRKYACECGHTWERLTEYSKNYVDPMDECEVCAKQQEQAESYVSKAPGVGGSIKSQAIDRTMNMLVDDYGIPGYQINDNMREGDTAVKSSGSPAAQVMPSPPNLYMNQGRANVSDFLAAGSQAGGIGDGSVTGLDIIENAKGAFNPLKNSTFETTSKKEYLP